MRFLGRGLVALVLLSVTLAALAWAGVILQSAVQARFAANDTPRVVRERVYAARVDRVEPGRIVPELSVYGEVRARRTLDLRAPRGGTVIYMAEGFEDGASVTAGQVLIRLDPADQVAARNLAMNEADRAAADARDAGRALALARDELRAAQDQAALRAQALERQRTLAARGVGSDAAIETAALAAASADQAVLARRQAVAQAEARVEQAATTGARLAINLSEAERALRDTEIRAEFSGVLSAVTAVAGGVVGGNERLAQIIDPTSLEVSFRVSTAQFTRLADAGGVLRPVGVTVTLDLQGAEVTATGRLTRVGGAVGVGQTGRLVYAALDAAPGLLPGDFVSVAVPEPALEGVAVLPAAAIGRGDTVLVLGEDDRLEEIAVEVLRRQGNDVIVTAAAIAGREVVRERTPLLGRGIKVRPIRPEGAAAPQAAVEEMVLLTPERRAALVAQVEANTRMPGEAKARLLAQLAQDQVPATLVARLETRLGG